MASLGPSPVAAGEWLRCLCQEIAEKCACLVSAEADVSNERLGKLIRNAEKDKIPVMAVVGAEVESNSLSIRT